MDNSRKIYYSMGEVSEMFDVNPSLIRFWEGKFDILKPHKNKKGNRMFTPEDVDNLKLIYHLVKEKGMTLSGAGKRIKENREGIERNLEVIEKLQGIKALLLEIKQELKTGDGGSDEIVMDAADHYESVAATPVQVPVKAPAYVSKPRPEPVPEPEPEDSEKPLAIPTVPMEQETPPEAQENPVEEVIPRILEQTLF